MIQTEPQVGAGDCWLRVWECLWAMMFPWE